MTPALEPHRRAARAARLAGGLLLVLATALPPAAGAQIDLGTGARAAPEAPAESDPEQERASLQERLEDLRSRAEGEAAQRELRDLERLEQVLALHVEARERAEDIEAAIAQLRAGIQTGPPADAGEPATLAELDAAIDAARAEEARGSALRDAISAAEAALRSAREDLAEAEAARRREAEAAELATDPSERARHARDAAGHERRARIERAQVERRRREFANTRLELELHELELAELQRRVASARARYARDPSALEDRLAEIEARRRELEAQARTTRRELDTARARQREAERQLEQDPADAVARARLAARSEQLTNERRRAAAIGEALRALDAEAEAWRRRVRVLGGDASGVEITRWTEQSEELLADARRQVTLASARLGELRGAVADLRREREAADGERRVWLDRQRESLAQRIALLESEQARIEQSSRVHRRLLADANAGGRGLSLWDRIVATWVQVRSIWTFELSAPGDNPITVGKIVSALLIFVFGWLLARGVAYLLSTRVFPRLKVERGVAAAYESLGFYVMMVIAFLVALRTVNIPLTAFAVLGGALAIGVGFGSQTVVNNFISGLILLAERPIKLGDLIDVDGTFGNVERIGLRSTRVRSGENVHIIVPNAAFLENRVVNWTHNNANVRLKLVVGVIYGSPTERVRELMLQALAEHERVLKSPAPVVLFSDFGANSLDFVAHFWVRMRGMMERLTIESDLRFRIDELFREEDLVIAFPQRDVHLDTTRPLEIRLSDGSDS